MPAAGSDQQRGGWYDVVERPRAGPRGTASCGTTARRGGSRSRRSSPTRSWPAHRRRGGLRLGREAAAFYNAFFLDYEEGGVYFNVLANGIPYLLGTERQKGSHSMAGYHSFELAYLGDRLHQPAHHEGADGPLLQPDPGALPNNILRVSPDILPPGSIRIGEV